MCETPGKMRMPEIVKIYLTVSEIVGGGGEMGVYYKPSVASGFSNITGCILRS